jgi:hypothetical protein
MAGAQLRQEMRYALGTRRRRRTRPKRIVAGQKRGGCEIRTREGLPPTRFPTMLTFVHDRPPPSASCANTIAVAAGERSRTHVNETTFETRPVDRHDQERMVSDPGAGPRGIHLEVAWSTGPRDPAAQIRRPVTAAGAESSGALKAVRPCASGARPQTGEAVLCLHSTT